LYGTHGAVGGSLFLAAYVLAMFGPFMRLLPASPPSVKWAAGLAVLVTAVSTVLSIRTHGAGGAGEGLGFLAGILVWAGRLATPRLASHIASTWPEMDALSVVGGSLPPLLMALTLRLVRRRRNQKATSSFSYAAGTPVLPQRPDAGPGVLDTERMALHARGFVERFLPPGADSGHSLLYGSGNRRAPDFVPSQESLDRCLQDYGKLVRLGVLEHPLRLLDFAFMDASELTIAYLSRCRDAGRTVPAQEGLAELIRKSEPELRQFLERTHGSGHDALKRLMTIAEILEIEHQV
jgi:hypothetical protein